MLDIVANYHQIEFKEKRMIQTQEHGETLRSGTNLD